MDRIDCLRTFVRALEGGSFSAAARELRIGQPAVSKRIGLLEAEFGTQLFSRTTRRFRPTPEALRIYEMARRILQTYDETRAAAQQAAPRPSGTLRVSVPSSFGRHYLIPIVAAYQAEYPGVRVDLRFSEAFVNMVEEGVELALRIGHLEASTLVARRLGTVQRYLVATPAYLQRRGTPRVPEDLRRHACIVYSRQAPTGEWAFESEDGRHVVNVGTLLSVDDADAMAEAVNRDLGIAILPEWQALGGVADRSLVEVLPDYTVPALPLHAVWPETQWMSLRARSFLDLLVTRAAEIASLPRPAQQQPR